MFAMSRVAAVSARARPNVCATTPNYSAPQARTSTSSKGRVGGVVSVESSGAAEAPAKGAPNCTCDSLRRRRQQCPPPFRWRWLRARLSSHAAPRRSSQFEASSKPTRVQQQRQQQQRHTPRGLSMQVLREDAVGLALQHQQLVAELADRLLHWEQQHRLSASAWMQHQQEVLGDRWIRDEPITDACVKRHDGSAGAQGLH